MNSLKDLAQVDSFGPIGRISQVSGRRLKGFIGPNYSNNDRIKVVESKEDCINLAKLIRKEISNLSPEITRLTTRAIIDNRISDIFVKSISDNSSARIDARIPLAGMPLNIFYIGYNRTERPISKINWLSYYFDISNQNSNSNQNMIGISNETRIEKGCSFISNKEKLIGFLVSNFGYNEGTASQIITDARTNIATVHVHGLMIGMCTIESRSIPLDFGVIHLSEITNAFIVDAYRHNGLYQNLSSYAISLLKDKRTLIFSESVPTLIPTIIKQNRKVGGLLPQHANITGELKDFIVTYW